MTPRKSGPSSRKRVASPRDHYMICDFTPGEVRQISAYCKAKGMSVSSFLADVAVTEVGNASKAPVKEDQIEITLSGFSEPITPGTITIKIPAEQKAKIAMFAHRQDKTADQFLRGLVLPTLQKAKTSFTSEIQTLRYYVSEHDHRMILDYVKKRKLSARTYISYLVLEALKRDKPGSQRKKTSQKRPF